MAGDDRGLAGELDVAYSSPEEFARLVLEWLTEAVRFLAGDVSDEILAGPPLKPYWHKGVIDEEDPRFALRVPPLWGDAGNGVAASRVGGWSPGMRGGRGAGGGAQRVRPAADYGPGS
jgi:hypothetical protein